MHIRATKNFYVFSAGSEPSAYVHKDVFSDVARTLGFNAALPGDAVAEGVTVGDVIFYALPVAFFG